MSERSYFFSHTDLDGIGSFVINDYFGISYDVVDVIDYNLLYNEEGQLIFNQKFLSRTNNDTVIIVDFAVNKDLYEFLSMNYPNFVWIDHHDETANYVSDNRVIYEKKSSGTKLYLQYLLKKLGKTRVSSKLKKFVDLVDTYDRYDDEHALWQEAQDLNRLFYKVYNWQEKENPIKATKRFIFSQVDKLRDNHEDFYFSNYEESLIQEVKERESKLYADAERKLSIRVDTKGRKFGVFAVPSKVSIIAYEILQAHTDLVYVIVINTYGGMTGKLSLRGSKFHEIDGNDLYHFAGHTKACGGHVTPELAESLLSDKTMSLPYKDEMPSDDVTLITK